MMKKLLSPLLSLALVALIAAPASAACLAEYKAKRDNPLELFYGTAVVDSPCTVAAARTQLREQLASQGMTLLKVLSVRQQ
jgi:type 1 fimbria pilin